MTKLPPLDPYRYGYRHFKHDERVLVRVGDSVRPALAKGALWKGYTLPQYTVQLDGDATLTHVPHNYVYPTRKTKHNREHPMQDIAIELSEIVKLEGWQDAAAFAGDDTVALKPDGRVVYEMPTEDVLVGTLTPEQYARVMMATR